MNLRKVKLTAREIEVVKLVASGKADKEIAADLGISVRTVRYHVSNIFRKINVSTRARVIVAALKLLP